MGTAVSKRKTLRSDTVTSVAVKVRAATAFSEYLSSTAAASHNGADHLLSDTFVVTDCESQTIGCSHNNNLPSQSCCQTKPEQPSPSQHRSPQAPRDSEEQSRMSAGASKRQLSAQNSLSAEDTPPRVYAITREGSMTLVGRGSEESLELEGLKTPAQAPPPRSGYHNGHPHRGNHHHGNQRQSASGASSRALKSSSSAGNIWDWGLGRGGPREESAGGVRPPCQSQQSLDLDSTTRKKRLERMYSEDGALSEDRDDGPNSWFPKENVFSFQTASTTMQAISNFRKHLRMVGSRRAKVQTFMDRRAKSFSRSWSDPTPVKPDSLHDSRDSGDLQASTGTLDESLGPDVDWDEERDEERAACGGEDFIPPKIMLISSKVPKAEYVPNIIRRDDPSIIPILYDHERASFDDILEEVEKKLTAYRKGCRIWNMLIFCQGGPGHLYLLKNKVATFAKVEKEEDMVQFWRRLSRLMSKLNPEHNIIHIMGCYVLGSTNGEKLIQTLQRLMRPSKVDFRSPLELSAQGKEMIETYFDFRLFRLWKSRQHSKLLDYDDLL